MEIKSESSIGISIILKLSESEARALKELTAYGTDAFLKMFYEHLGKYTMQPQEAGLRSLFDSIDAELPRHLWKIDKARQALKPTKSE